ncbi:hypothetical protein BCV70DRAFT_203200 [Testicularia cyperi]|uniref:Secreted protein n=1 Tax=Testicularia cyperi TaxID=1882483 RepID=A0A317XGV6_9BASI|nr:hypothetical protein BCV70DRAFT_203200 [Testicularia cyperi]
MMSQGQSEQSRVLLSAVLVAASWLIRSPSAMTTSTDLFPAGCFPPRFCLASTIHRTEESKYFQRWFESRIGHNTGSKRHESKQHKRQSCTATECR